MRFSSVTNNPIIVPCGWDKLVRPPRPSSSSSPGPACPFLSLYMIDGLKRPTPPRPPQVKVWNLTNCKLRSNLYGATPATPTSTASPSPPMAPCAPPVARFGSSPPPPPPPPLQHLPENDRGGAYCPWGLGITDGPRACGPAPLPCSKALPCSGIWPRASVCVLPGRQRYYPRPVLLGPSRYEYWLRAATQQCIKIWDLESKVRPRAIASRGSTFLFLPCFCSHRGRI